MKEKPGISVLMPAYNVGDFIGAAIRSVLSQSFNAFELVIVNDGSTDHTEAVVRSFNDSRIVLHSQDNKGVAAALNRGLQLASAHYIVRFDADDICYPHRLGKQYRYMVENPACVIAGSSADYVDQNGGYVFTHFPPAYADRAIKSLVTKTCPFIHSSVIFKKAVITRHGGYNEHAHSFEDHFLWRSVLNEGRAANLPDSMIQVRLNPASITIDEQWRPKEFHLIKRRVIKENSITADEGAQLLSIIRTQDHPKLKQSAYHSLLAKKFLWNNYQPQKARLNLRKVIAKNRLHWKSYCFYALSYLPPVVLQKGYRLLKPQTFSFTPKAQNRG